jgi:YD repeat-containing protein
VAVAVLLASGVGAQDLYKHVDDQGRVTYTNVPTKAGSATYELQTERSKTSAGSSAAAEDPTALADPAGTIVQAAAGNGGSGNVTKIDTPEGPTEYEYNDVGLLTKVTTPETITTYTYSPDRELLGKDVQPR